jgi:N-acetylglucosamine-6-sulfatase
MTPRSLAVALALAASAVRAAPAAERAAPPSLSAPKLPNFIWLITDDMDLNGYQVMPRLQTELLGKGTAFHNSFVASPKCCPSRTSALSGRFPHGMDAASLGWCGNFAAEWENRTFFVGLQQAGYTTAAIGKYFNQEPSFCGPNIHVPAGMSDCFLMCEEVRYYNLTYNDNGKTVKGGDAPTDYLTSVLGNRSLAFLRSATEAAQPFFLYLAVHAPHLPAVPAPWYANATVPTRAPRDPNWNTGRDGKHWQVATNGPMGDYYIAASDALFADRLRTLLSVDDIVGDLVDELTASGQLDNTYIVFSSDHSYHNGQYSLWAEKVSLQLPARCAVTVGREHASRRTCGSKLALPRRHPRCALVLPSPRRRARSTTRTRASRSSCAARACPRAPRATRWCRPSTWAPRCWSWRAWWRPAAAPRTAAPLRR